MRILYDNIMKNASLVATNEDPNYPIGNIVHRFMRKYFKSTTTSSVITATCNADVTVNCIFIGYHNATSGSLVLKDDEGTTLSTITLTSISGVDPYVLYFTEEDEARTIVLTLNSTTDNLYAGNMAIGDYLTMPGMNPEATFGRVINSSINETDDGYLTGFNRAVLLNPQFSFPVVDQTELNSIISMIEDIGYSVPIWMDAYEDDDTLDPLYCRVSAFDTPKKLAQNGRLYSLGMTFKEIR